jgi:hypothetical protein
MRALLLTLLVFIAGCSTVDPTAKLRIGMSKDEAIAIMGQPASVSAQASTEYLNYYRSESSGISYMTRPYYVRLADGKVDAFGFSEQLMRSSPPSPAAGVVARSATPATTDGLRIMSMEPATLVRNKAQPVIVTVHYALNSAAEGTIEVLFNTYSATAFRPLGSQVVQRGVGDVTIKMTVTPSDWGEFNEFKMTALLRTGPSAPGARALASQQRTIPLTN